MQNRSYVSQPSVMSSVKRASSPKPVPHLDDLTRIFNTAIVSTQNIERRDLSSELYALTESASFKAILNSVRQLAQAQGVNERQAAEQIIQTFRKMDEVWTEYVAREGLDQIRKPR